MGKEIPLSFAGATYTDYVRAKCSLVKIVFCFMPKIFVVGAAAYVFGTL